MTDDVMHRLIERAAAEHSGDVKDLPRHISDAVKRARYIEGRMRSLQDDLNAARTKWDNETRIVQAGIAAMQGDCNHPVVKHHVGQESGDSWTECEICGVIV